VQRALQWAERRGARSLLADGLSVRAQAGWLQGDLRQAGESGEAARRLHAALGQSKALADDLNVLLAVRWQQGRLSEAAAFTEEVVAIQRRLGSDAEAAVNLANLGFIRVRQGRLEEARQRFLEARGLREAAEPWQGVPGLGLAWITALRGDLPGAVQAYARALQQLQGFEEPYPRGFLLLRQAELRGERGELDEARQALVEVREEMARIGLRPLVAEARLAEATLLLRAGQVAEAEGLAQGAREELHRMDSGPGEAVAQSLLASAAARRGDQAPARAAVAEANRLLASTDDQLAALTVAVQTGRAACTIGDEPADAAAALVRAAAAAGQAGFRCLELEAGLAAAACSLPAGDARTRLQALARAARQAGFTGLADAAERP
jgi:tetratricopeptide (TPR) repeat protein